MVCWVVSTLYVNRRDTNLYCMPKLCVSICLLIPIIIVRTDMQLFLNTYVLCYGE